MEINDLSEPIDFTNLSLSESNSCERILKDFFQKIEGDSIRLLPLSSFCASCIESAFDATTEKVKHFPERFFLQIDKSEIEEAKPVVEDSYLWLEQIHGDRALQWVENQNRRTVAYLESLSNFNPLENRCLSILNSQEKLLITKKRENYYYTYRIDENNKRGVWLRTPAENFETLDQSEVNWEVVLDLDELAEKENENWVWKGSIDLNGYHGLLQFSRGGRDAVVIREFDYQSKQFIEDGFYLPEAKSIVRWKDENTLYVGTDFGPDSLTQSGFPRVVKEWQRGTQLSAAWPIFEADSSDIMTYAYQYFYEDFSCDIAVRYTSFYSSITYIKKENWWVPLQIPADARLTLFKDQFILDLQSDWTKDDQTFKAGTILGIDGKKCINDEFVISILFEPDARSTVANVTNTKNYLILKVLENLQNKTLLFKHDSGNWIQETLETPPFGTCSIVSSDDQSDRYEMFHSDFLTPNQKIQGDLADPSKKIIHSLPNQFQTDDLEVTQNMATSIDGTLIPYYQVCRKGLNFDGSNPTLLYGYGGFDVSMEPTYDPLLGAAWLEKGGVYIVANIRGGGEFGSDWHKAALRENRQNAYDDFIAVAEDLIARGVTTPVHLGIQGGSNGGLLMGVMLTQRPDLWGAVLCQQPLLDMKRYHQLFAGACWIEEFGNPDIEEEWSYLKKYSPYQNIHPGIKYPKILFMTSTADDLVHPGHARKMAAKMIDQGCDVLFYENTEGGHAGATNADQIAFKNALQFSFLWQALH